MKDLDPETVFALIEAKDFIKLTEQVVIKSALEDCDNPITMLYQILEFSFVQFDRFDMLKLLHGAAKDPFINKIGHLLTEAIESEICRFFK